MGTFKRHWRKYQELGLIPYPASRKGKNPIPQWGEDLPPPCTDDYEEWEAKYPDANIWVLLGPHFAVLDPDGPGAEEFVRSLNLPDCPISISGNKSVHRWFKVSKPVEPIKARNGDGTFLELRTGRMGMLVPPSIHPKTGKGYAWLQGFSPYQVPFPELPEEAYQKILALVSKSEPPKLERPISDNSLGSLDVARYLDHHGIKYTIKPWKGATIYALDKCLFAEHHTTTDQRGDSGIIQGSDGKLAYQCFHNHCAMRTWHDARQAISGDASIAEFCENYVPQAQKAKNPIKECPFTFPEHVMKGLAGEFADLYASYLEPPRVFFYFSFLTCLGAMLSGRLTLASEIAPQPRLYAILLGESGDDRKSTALATAVAFFQRYFSAGFNVCHGVGSAEGLQERINESSDTRLILIYDEFKAFISKCKIEASVLLPCVNTLFESNRHESRTKHRDIRLENAHLTLLAASTVQTYENVWTSQFTDIGFHNRLFLVPGSGERRFPIPRQIPEENKKALAERVSGAIRQVGENLAMPVTRDAHDAFKRWYLGLESSPHSKRIDTYALRIMPLLAINEGRDRVDLQTVQKTTTIMDWQLEVRRELDPIDAENQVARMEEKIRRALKNGPASERDLKRKVHYDRAGIWIYNQAIKNLSHGGARDIWFDRKAKRWTLIA